MGLNLIFYVRLFAFLIADKGLLKETGRDAS